MKKKPNIVMFFADDQRFDTIAALGNKTIKTPNLDELVRDGTTFTRAHIPGGTSGAVCMPSRAMLHTGKTLFHLEKNGQEIPEDHVMLGEALQKAGYSAYGIGKWHNGTRSFARSFTGGAEIFFGGMWDHWNVPACDYDPTGQYGEPKNFIPNLFADNKVVKSRGDHIQIGKHSSELFCEAAVNWLDKREGEEPFFMYVSFLAPHDPRSMPDEFLSMYNPEDIDLPENYMDKHPFEFGVRNLRDELLAPYPRDPQTVKRHIAEYYGMISHLDNELGKVIRALKRNGIYDETIIVFAGDNGLAIGQHGLFGKQNNYEHSIRVPLIFAGPGIPKNEKRDAYVYLLDIFPTLCELIDEEIPQTVEGISLASVIRGEKAAVRDTLYFAYLNSVRSIKDDRFKLIEYRKNEVRETQLFDLEADPYEIHNLFGKAGYEEAAEKLRSELFRYRDEWGDEQHPFGKTFWGNFQKQ